METDFCVLPTDSESEACSGSDAELSDASCSDRTQDLDDFPTTTLRGDQPDPAEMRYISRTEHVERGTDIQGIDWNLLRREPDEARERRRDVYENYLNIPDLFAERWAMVRRQEEHYLEMDGQFFGFASFQGSREPSILHFQLRNLLWAANGTGFFFLSGNTIKSYDSYRRKTREVLDLNNNMHGIHGRRVLVSTICAGHGLLAAGGFHGELVIASQDGSIWLSTLMTSTDSAITNGIEIYDCEHGKRLVAANNDNRVRIFDCEEFQETSSFEVPWPANYASPSPDAKTLAVVGDDQKALLFDAASCKRVAELSGHLDFSFAAAWHPAGMHLATGNQDTSTRIWDVRNLKQALHMLPGEMSAVRSLRYSPCGRFLAAAEAADYVWVYDTVENYGRAQSIQFFSEITGISFTPDARTLMIGLRDPRWGGFMRYSRGIGEGLDLQGTVDLRF